MMIQKWYKKSNQAIKAVVICDEVTTELTINDEYDYIPQEATDILENLGYVSMGTPEEG